MDACTGRLTGIGLGAAALALVGACSTSAQSDPTKTVTVRPSETVAVQPPASSSSSGTAGASRATTAFTSARPAMTKLPGGCDTVLPLSSVGAALGGAVAGRTAFVVGVAEKNIGRLAYLNCRYGLPGGAAAQATPKVEIGVSLYRTPALAAQRIPATVADYVAHGASESAATVGDTPATILVGGSGSGSGSGYGTPTIVMVSSQRTIAISVAAGLVPAAERAKTLTALAELAMKRTGG